MNLKTLDWDESILKEFRIKKSILATIKPCNDNFGYLNLKGFEHIVINCVMGDQ